MLDIRTVDYEHIHIEEPKLLIGEQFVAHSDDLDSLPDEERQSVVTQVAKMVTAAEVYIFDGEIGACHINCQVYEIEDGTQMGILVAAEKTNDGVHSDIAWVSPQQLIQTGFSYEEVRNLGFSMTA
jgi:hypothetical protein